MKIFVTGGTGNIGSAVVKEFISNGYEVVGLARSKNSAKKLEDMGASSVMGEVSDPESLKDVVEKVDGVIHLAFMNSAIGSSEAVDEDLNFVEKIGSMLEGTNKPFVITNHQNGDKSIDALMNLNKVNTSVINLPPTVHGEGDVHGFVPQIIEKSKENKTVVYTTENETYWPSVHRLDAAVLYRLLFEKAQPKTLVLAWSEKRISNKDLAMAIGEKFGLNVENVSVDKMKDYLGEFLGTLIGLNLSNLIPQNNVDPEMLGWQPMQNTLLADIENGVYSK